MEKCEAFLARQMSVLCQSCPPRFNVASNSVTTAQNDSLKTLDYHRFPVLHLFHQFHSVGGVESVLRLHRDHDPAIGVQSDLIIFLDDPSSSVQRVHCLGMQFDDSVGTIEKKLRTVAQTLPDRMAIYHLGWNFAFFCPNDHSHRRIMIIHGHSPGLPRFLKRNSAFLDGILCVNNQLRSTIEDSVPKSLSDRIGVVGYPICPPDGQRQHELISDPVRIGFIGRLQVEQKRIDRIPDFCSALEKLALNYSLEVLGTGVHAHLLEEKRQQHKLVLHGALQGADYWRTLRQLDCVVFFSDFEGTPIAMIEAMSQGVIPIFPAINCGADAYVPQVADFLMYPPGDVQAAASIVERIIQLPPQEIFAMRQRCRDAVKSHSLTNYFKQTFDFAQRIWNLPRISSVKSSLAARLIRPLTLRQINFLRSLTRTPTR
jgi:glycosyltransferase involved in cell wall biosynthesis